MFYVLFMCKCVLPPGVNPIEVDKYVNINIKIPHTRVEYQPEWTTELIWTWRRLSPCAVNPPSTPTGADKTGTLYNRYFYHRDELLVVAAGVGERPSCLT
jgi:hypothetical protein